MRSLPFCGAAEAEEVGAPLPLPTKIAEFLLSRLEEEQAGSLLRVSSLPLLFQLLRLVVAASLSHLVASHSMLLGFGVGFYSRGTVGGERGLMSE